MRIHAIRVTTLLFCFTTIVCTTAQAEKPKEPYQPRAAVISVNGNGIAKVRHKSGIETVLGANQTLYPGDKITTDAATVAQIMLPDGTVVRLGYNTEYRIEAAKAETGMIAWAFQLTKGTIRALVEKSGPKKDTKFRVNTPAGTMGVRGTEFILEHIPETETTTLYTLEGKIAFGPPNCDAKKNCVMVMTGQKVSLKKGGKVSAVTAFKIEDVAQATGAAAKAASKKAGTGSAVLTAADANSTTEGNAEGDATSAELMARLSVLQSLGSAGKDASMLDDTQLKKDAAASGQQLQSLQDSLLNRSAAVRNLMNAAAASGTYDDYLALGEAAAKQAGSSALSTDPDHISGVANTRKFEAAALNLVSTQSSQGSDSSSAVTTGATQQSGTGASSFAGGTLTAEQIAATLQQKELATAQTVAANGTALNTALNTDSAAKMVAAGNSQVNTAQTALATWKQQVAAAAGVSAPLAEPTNVSMLSTAANTSTAAGNAAATQTQTQTQANTETTANTSDCYTTAHQMGLDFALCTTWIYGKDRLAGENVSTALKNAANSYGGPKSCYSYRQECTSTYVPCDTSKGKACQASVSNTCKGVQVPVACQ